MSLTFTIDRKGNVLGSRIETNFRRSRREGNRSAQTWLAVRGAATRHQLRQGSQAVLRIMDEANAKQSPTARR
jgi:hypothetical protein